MANRQDSDREVLTSLPRTRPVRRSAKRGDRPDTKSGATASPRRAASAQPRAAKMSAAKATTARSAKPKGAAKATPGAKAAARSRAASGAAKATPKAARPSGERPRVPPRRKVPPAGYAAPSSRSEQPAASGTAELIGTTLQAAAELAQIGLTVGRQTLQSMFDRLPKP